MNGLQFDLATMHLAQTRPSRRSVLGRGSRGLAAIAFALGAWPVPRVMAAPAAPATPAASPEPSDMNAIEIDGAWFCNQTFALCTTAPCELSQSDPSIANCRCVVEEAYAIGFKSCTERAPAGLSLHSNFSTANVNSAFSIMYCPDDAAWANCLDVPCEIDPLNPAVATCQCEMVAQGPSLTFGGGCNISTCTSMIWSAAPLTYLGLAQYEAGMAMVNQEIVIPATCPPATPPATPASTPTSA